MPETLPDGGWHQRVAPQGTRWALLVVAVALVLVAWVQLWLVIPTLAVSAFLFLRSVVDVRIDGGGLSVQALLRRPRLEVPAVDVLRAEVRAHVEPVQDFGGHGWRTSQGGTQGVVVRAGEALVVERRDDSPVVITVDDATGAAAALTAAARATRLR